MWGAGEYSGAKEDGRKNIHYAPGTTVCELDGGFDCDAVFVTSFLDLEGEEDGGDGYPAGVVCEELSNT